MAKRLIDAERLLQLRYTHIVRFWDGKLIKSFPLSEAPTVDAVEVTRCRDCKHWSTEYGGYMDDEPHCGNPDGIDGYTQADDFCSYGERKEG